MKKSIVLPLALLLLATALGACSHGVKDKMDNEALEKEFDNAPAWVLTGKSKDDLFAAVGSAVIGKGGKQFAHTEAMANGRSELARQISVKVQGLVNNFTQQTGVGTDQTLDAFARQVSKQVSDETLSGSMQKDIWISPSKELYVLMVLDKNAVESSVRRQVLNSYQQNSAKWQEFQAKNGNEALDRELKSAFDSPTP
ncbi:MAG: LPP20 family lipoprotein [Desulfobacterales bacterium]|nr:LPP20 family lipoprotein [Desulfobacterales bacterium]